MDGWITSVFEEGKKEKNITFWKKRPTNVPDKDEKRTLSFAPRERFVFGPNNLE
jgi:hypothetical protein